MSHSTQKPIAPSRRAFMASVPAVAATLTPAGAATLSGLAPSGAGPSSDVELRRLWELYLARDAARISAHEKTIPARAAFDAEFPECPDGVRSGDHFHAYQWLWRNHGLDLLCDDWNAADKAVRETVATIQKTPAEGLVGIGIKLAALNPERDDVDYDDAIVAALVDIDRLAGTSLAETLAGAIDGEAQS